MKEENIPNADELIINMLVLPNTIINFKKVGLLMIIKSYITNEEYAVEKARYLGEGKWESINKIPLKKIDIQAHKSVGDKK